MLTEEQRKQTDLQYNQHKHRKYETDIQLEKAVLYEFIVHPNVMRPEIMSSRYLAEFLFTNNELYIGNTVIDMGCGSGLQGVVTGIKGAGHVILSDISEYAVENARENTERFGLAGKTTIVQGDLFENISASSKLVVFNHPFFADAPDDSPISISMLDEGDLIHRFLEVAKEHLNENGIIIMPYFHPAGLTNNPQIQGPKHGYDVHELYSKEVVHGIQKGNISIYKLKLG